MKRLYFLAIPIFFFAQAAFANPIANLYSKEGSVQAQLAQAGWRAVDTGAEFSENDSLKTSAGARAGVRFNSGFLIRLKERSELRFTKEMAGNEQPLSLDSGAAYFFSRDSRRFPRVNTPHVSASVRGTEFVVEVRGSETIISVLEGQVEASNKFGSASIGRGEFALVQAGKAPVVQVMLNPLDAVQWALYYPRGINPSAPKNQAERALVALINNDKVKASEIITAEHLKNPRSTEVLLVMSYVAQSEFDLESSKKALEELLKIDPNDLLARARLAELHLAFSDTKSASKEIEQVLAKEPNHAYALSVRGFSDLIASDTTSAKATFDRAIAVDQSFALPHLGLGLALIKEGALEAGRKEIEDAVHLEPNVSLYRSYLGKAFFEEEKEDLSGREYVRAIELDPNDPTPLLYRSFLRQSQHRPIEALKDLQKSIDLNDNRAVFRSRFLLDQDLGTRSASLGRVYNRLGFSELARVEAFKALSKDYANFSAHFLLADLYSETHLTSRAQTTENLIGRLLVPPTFNSNDRSLDSKAGLNEYTSLFERPQDRTALEFSADSDLERLAGQADYTYSSNNIGHKLGYAASDRSGFRENDFRREQQVFSQGQYQLSKENTLVWDAALNANEQGDIVIDSDPLEEDKDVESELDSGLIRLGLHREVGLNGHVIAQAFYNRGSFENRDLGDGSRIGFIDVTEGGSPLTTVPFPFGGSTDQEVEIDQDLARGDLQYIWDGRQFSFVLGTSYRYERLEQDESSSVSAIGPESVLSFLSGFPLSSSEDVSQNSERYFLYNTWHATEDLDLTAGLVYSRIDLVQNESSGPFVDANFEDDQLGPKLGVLYQLAEKTTLRAAYGQTLDRTQSGGIGPLEPTFVGGFNQVFDGVRGSEQDFYGIGLDQTVSENTYIGTNFQFRDIDLKRKATIGGLDIETGSLATSATTDEIDLSAQADESRTAIYWYQILSDQVSSDLQYVWEDFDQRDLTDFKTHKVSWGLNYFCPSGMFAFANAAWRIQNQEDSSLDRTRDFWIFDAGVGYEFAKRQGAVRLKLNNLFDKSYYYSHIRDESTVQPGFGAVVDLNYNF